MVVGEVVAMVVVRVYHGVTIIAVEGKVGGSGLGVSTLIWWQRWECVLCVVQGVGL